MRSGGPTPSSSRPPRNQASSGTRKPDLRAGRRSRRAGGGGATSLTTHLVAPSSHLDERRQRERQLDQPVVQERRPQLERRGHRHPVAALEQVVGEPGVRSRRASMRRTGRRCAPAGDARRVSGRRPGAARVARSSVNGANQLRRSRVPRRCALSARSAIRARDAEPRQALLAARAAPRRAAAGHGIAPSAAARAARGTSGSPPNSSSLPSPDSTHLHVLAGAARRAGTRRRRRAREIGASRCQVSVATASSKSSGGHDHLVVVGAEPLG